MRERERERERKGRSGVSLSLLPQAVTGSKGEKSERVVWAKFETGDLNG